MMKHILVRNTSQDAKKLSNDEIYENFINLPRYRAARNATPINQNNKDGVIIALRWLVDNDLYCCAYKFNLTRLASYANVDEILECVKKYHEWFVNGKPTRSLYDRYYMTYGSCYANDYVIKQNIRSSISGKANYKKNIGSQKAKEKSIASRNAKNKEASYRRRKNPLCIEYYLSRGYSITEADALLSGKKKSFSLCLSWFISKYGEDEGLKLYADMVDRRNDSISKSLSLGRAGYSAISQVVFDNIRDYLYNKWGIDKNILFYATNGGEYFLRKPNGGCYYLDFCIPSLDVCIEFHGCAWHPKSKESYKPIFGRSYESALAQDKIKEDLIRTKYDLYIIWEDCVNYDEVYTWLDERIFRCSLKKMI